MSKRKKNYPDPLEIINKFGSDALRLYLINSPVVRAECLRFKEKGVHDLIKELFLPWYNSFRYLIQNISILEKKTSEKFFFEEQQLAKVSNQMDIWILSYLQTLINFIHQEMKSFRLYTVVSRILDFLDNLTNWYIRLNRSRLRGESENDDNDHRVAISTLFKVQYEISKIFAPFIPFMTEFVYQHLLSYVKHDFDDKLFKSVHFQMLPCTKNDFVDEKVEAAVKSMQSVVELTRVIRDKHAIPMKFPLRSLVILHKDENFATLIKPLLNYIQTEINVKSISTSWEIEKYGVKCKLQPDLQLLGKRLRNKIKDVTNALKMLSIEDLNKTRNSEGNYIVAGEQISESELKIFFYVESEEKLAAHSDGKVIVLLDITKDEVLLEESFARELINRVQKLRKKAGLVPTDEITVYCGGSNDDCVQFLRRNLELMRAVIKQTVSLESSDVATKLLEESQETVGPYTLSLKLFKA